MKLINLLDNPTPTVAELAKKYKTDPHHVQAQLTKGIKVELEHTSHEHVARRIALAHLGERLDYYTQLAKIDEDQISSHKPVQDPTLDTHNQTLSHMVAQDQSERNEYQQFVKTKADGDWHKGAKMYAAFKNRSQDDVFGERDQLQKFMDMQFDFDQFTQTDWDNYWLLAQHCDFNRTFQKQALNIITKYLGTDHSHYRYLHDRISCGTSGTQKYGTQDICSKDHTVSDLQQIQESIINNEQGWGKVPNNQNVDYLGLRVNMKPSMFLKLAAPLARADASSVKDMVQHLNSGGTVASPWLVIHIPEAWEQGDYDQAAKVISHEGRNRMYAIQEVQGDAPVEVHVFFGAGMRARHIQPDWVDHMMHELVPQGQKTPQQGPWFTPMPQSVQEVSSTKFKNHNTAMVNEDQVPGTQFVTLNASQLKEALAYLEELAENIDSDSVTYSDNTTIYSKLDKDYKAITAVEYVMKNNMKALKDPQLAQDSIFLYDIDDSDLSYIEFVGAIHVVIAHKVAEVKWIGSYDANGAGLLRAAMQIAKDRGALEMKLEAKWQSEGFYTKMGFEQAGASVDQPFSGSQLTPFKKKLAEKWSAKYKKSIDCGKPKGFSQRAHCAGRRTKTSHVSEATTRTSKVGAPGTLKAKISGPVTCDKVKKLKQRSNATPHDVRQANWFINMHGCSESTQLTEIFREPAQHMKWNQGKHGEYQFFETEFAFQGKRVKVGLYEDHNQTSAKFVARNTDLDLPPTYKGYSVVFSVNGSTDVTGEIGAAASKLFAQVVSVLKGLLSTNAWDYVLFIGEEGSRDKLYDALAHLLARQVGAQVATYRSDFLIYKSSHLQEVFDYKLKRDDWYGVGKGIIGFKVDDQPYELEILKIEKSPGIFEVIFAHAGVPRDISTSVIGTGSAQKVFAAVAQLIEYAVKQLKIRALYFTAEEPSRIKLYKVLTKYFATKFNWKVSTDPQFMPYTSRDAQFLVYKPGFSLTESGGVGLVVPGVNMPAGIHPDEIRRQARKLGFKVSKHGVPPVARTDGKM